MPSITIEADGQSENVKIDAAVVTLGRGLESDIRLRDLKSSRRHCQLVMTSAGYKLVDLGSGNGTLLNGTPVKEKLLNTGDQIQIGQTVITYEAGGPKTAAAPVAARKAHAPKRVAPPPVEAEPEAETEPVAAPAARPAPARSRGAHGPPRIRHSAGAKKSSPLVVVALVGGVIVLGAVGYVVMSGKAGGEPAADPAKARKRIETKLAEAATSGELYHYKQQKELLLEAADIAKHAPEDLGLAKIKRLIEAAEKNEAAFEAAHKVWTDYEAKVNAPFAADAGPGLKQEGEALKSGYGGKKWPWIPKLDAAIAKVDLAMKVSTFEGFKSVIQADCLSDDKQPLLGRAIKRWTEEFIPKASIEDVALAKAEIANHLERARQITKGGMTAASQSTSRTQRVRVLRDLLVLVEGCEFEAEVLAELKQYE